MSMSYGTSPVVSVISRKVRPTPNDYFFALFSFYLIIALNSDNSLIVKVSYGCMLVATETNHLNQKVIYFFLLQKYWYYFFGYFLVVLFVDF